MCRFVDMQHIYSRTSKRRFTVLVKGNRAPLQISSTEPSKWIDDCPVHIYTHTHLLYLI